MNGNLNQGNFKMQLTRKKSLKWKVCYCRVAVLAGREPRPLPYIIKVIILYFKKSELSVFKCHFLNSFNIVRENKWEHNKYSRFWKVYVIARSYIIIRMIASQVGIFGRELRFEILAFELKLHFCALYYF